ncbi:retrotransposon gag protein [Cucumis melo var. makuwa]|uniref:Retrotransposon gag protein n=1 Tax=Cucumis melo var. makuwa TaxID=1194695 RepID=A0A5D3CT83_CUCMM|nr:retrotransposon gag protein [Cucumis melo var. makuwa]
MESPTARIVVKENSLYDNSDSVSSNSKKEAHPDVKSIMMANITVEAAMAKMERKINLLMKVVEERGQEITSLREQMQTHETAESSQTLVVKVTDKGKNVYGRPPQTSFTYSKLYTKRIDNLRMSLGYQPPKFQQFDGKGNLKQHIAHFVETCENVGLKGDQLVRQFIRSLKGNAFEWYTDLKPKVIQSWEQLEKEFLKYIADMLEQLLEKQLIQLLELEKCFVFKELILRLACEKKIELDLEEDENLEVVACHAINATEEESIPPRSLEKEEVLKDLSSQRVTSMTCLEHIIGNLKASALFHVIDSRSTYKLLLGRPCIHENGVVTSTLHQCFKFYQDGIKKGEADSNPFSEAESHFVDAKFYLKNDSSPEAMPVEIPLGEASTSTTKSMILMDEKTSNPSILCYVPLSRRKKGKSQFVESPQGLKVGDIEVLKESFTTPLTKITKQEIKIDLTEASLSQRWTKDGFDPKAYKLMAKAGSLTVKRHDVILTNPEKEDSEQGEGETSCHHITILEELEIETPEEDVKDVPQSRGWWPIYRR